MTSRNKPESPRGGEPDTVLVVDPDVVTRNALAGYLRACGYRLVEAVGQEDARKVLESGLRVDAILSEIDLGGDSSGFELARWVRARHPDCAVFLAASVSRAAALAGALCESGPLVSKPYDHARLADLIRQRLAGRRAARAKTLDPDPE